MNTIDQLSRDDLKALQERLTELGFDVGRIDGIWGPRTGRAYEAYLATRKGLEITVPVITPAPAKPWWRTGRAKGWLTAIAGLAALFIPALREVDTTYLIGLIWDNLDHVDAIITSVGALVTVVGTAWSAIGAVRANAPIDSHLLLPGVRLPGGVREPVRPSGLDDVSSKGADKGNYWGSSRGPFEPD